MNLYTVIVKPDEQGQIYICAVIPQQDWLFYNSDGFRNKLEGQDMWAYVHFFPAEDELAVLRNFWADRVVDEFWSVDNPFGRNHHSLESLKIFYAGRAKATSLE